MGFKPGLYLRWALSRFIPQGVGISPRIYLRVWVSHLGYTSVGVAPARYTSVGVAPAMVYLRVWVSRYIPQGVGILVHTQGGYTSVCAIPQGGYTSVCAIPQGVGERYIPQGVGERYIPQGVDSACIPQGVNSACLPQGVKRRVYLSGCEEAGIPLWVVVGSTVYLRVVGRQHGVPQGVEEWVPTMRRGCLP